MNILGNLGRGVVRIGQGLCFILIMVNSALCLAGEKLQEDIGEHKVSEELSATDDLHTQKKWTSGGFPDGSSLCFLLLTELNYPNDKRVDLVNFPRSSRLTNGIQRIEWQILDAHKNRKIIYQTLAYLFKNDDSKQTPPPNDDGVIAFNNSLKKQEYDQLLSEGQIVLQKADFDIDGDAKSETVYRVGRKLTVDIGGGNYTFDTFNLQKGGIADWQYLVFLHDDNEGTIASGLQFDAGGLGDASYSNTEGVFLYKNRAVFYAPHESSLIFRQYKRVGLTTWEDDDLFCGFSFGLE